jgi:hypothetical protein
MPPQSTSLLLCVVQVRKRGAGCVVDVLAALQSHPAALGAASDAIAKLATGVLAGPEVRRCFSGG